MSDRLVLGAVWFIECSRCANEAVSFETSADEARGELAELGWTNEGGDHYCPGCNEAAQR